MSVHIGNSVRAWRREVCDHHIFPFHSMKGTDYEEASIPVAGAGVAAAGQLRVILEAHESRRVVEWQLVCIHLCPGPSCIISRMEI